MRRSGLQRAGTAVEIIHVLNRASPQRDDELGHGFGLLRWQQQVRVIRHRYIRVQRTFRLTQGFTQPMQVTVVFILGGEALPIVCRAARYEVERCRDGYGGVWAFLHATKLIRTSSLWS